MNRLKSLASLESGTPERTSSCVRARSVSPTSANPWFSPSVHDDSLDDTADVGSVDQRFINESRDNAFPRPATPLPPVLSDDDSPLTPNNFENDLMTGVQSTVGTTMMSSRSTDNVLASVITRFIFMFILIQELNLFFFFKERTSLKFPLFSFSFTLHLFLLLLSPQMPSYMVNR